MKTALSLLVAIVLGLGALASQAQEFPSKSIKYIVPYPPGGSGDFLGRLYAQYLSENLGQPVIVENKPGAATNIGLEQLARSEPDGYTIMQGTGQTQMNMVFGPIPTPEALNGVVPVAMTADMPLMIAANPKAGIGSVKELIEKAKAQRLTISHAQFEPQLQLLKIATGADIDSIPYKGGAPSAMAAIAGDVTLVAAYVPVLMAQVKAGKLRAVGVAGRARATVLPEVPTFAEQGYPKFVTAIWYSVMAPKGTPDPVLRKLTAASLAVVKNPNFASRLQAGGGEPFPATPQEVVALMQKELQIWRDVAKEK